MANENSNVVVDRAQSHWSDLWKKEDYWAIWLGFALLIAAICIFINGAPASYKETIDKSNAIMKVEAEKAPFKTIAYIQAQDAKKGVVGTNLPIAKEIKAFIASPGKWTDNPVKSMFTSQAEADAKNAANKEKAEAAKAKAESSFAAAQAAEKLAADAGYKDASLNTAAEAAIKDWTKAKADASKASAKAKPVNLFTTLPLLMVAFALFFGIGIFVMGQNLPKFLIGFVGLFVVVVIAMILGKQSTMAYYGIGVEPWGIMFGMIIANTIGTPQWMKPALQVEYFIKTGLVLLGAEILFDKIIAIGTAGIFVAWVVTPIVLITTFIFGQKVLKMASPTLNITISADMSVCGTSAAIALTEKNNACGSNHFILKSLLRQCQIHRSCGTAVGCSGGKMSENPGTVNSFPPEHIVRIRNNVGRGTGLLRKKILQSRFLHNLWKCTCKAKAVRDPANFYFFSKVFLKKTLSI